MKMWTKSFSVFVFSCFLSLPLVLTKRVLTETERQMAIDSGIDLDSISDDTVFITPAELSDEERGSKFMPTAYRCDGCSAIAYQLQKRFKAAEKKKKVGDPLGEAEVLEVFEELCDGEFENYGVKNVQGIKVLSGEGLPGDRQSGMVEAGGVWKSRMQNICNEVSGEYEEENIYKWYQLQGAPFRQLLCRNYCDDDDGLSMKMPSHTDEL
ncbi:marginal zone B- and B1-cell-specific protein [Aplysia californica]|uniref:Marginal zone B- and B1-cell-specific protein n=1 Tax=Aplysia californica TaxID=6500 RepID=A0ABM0JRK5_APLCA|nr:marginal zone B- and B1-cell-specific protein [Aplysia californica]